MNFMLSCDENGQISVSVVFRNECNDSFPGKYFFALWLHFHFQIPIKMPIIIKACFGKISRSKCRALNTKTWPTKTFFITDPLFLIFSSTIQSHSTFRIANKIIFPEKLFPRNVSIQGQIRTWLMDFQNYGNSHWIPKTLFNALSILFNLSFV